MTAPITQHWAIIVAAGSGSRFGSDTPKQFHTIAIKTVLEHTLAAFVDAKLFAGIVLVTNKADQHLQALTLPPQVAVVDGGKERADSVQQGLCAIQPQVRAQDFVWVHDGARPCIGGGFLTDLKAELGEHAVGGIPAIAVVDTIKQGHNSEVVKTVPRDDLWRAQTPQIFRYQLVNDAMQAAKAKGAIVTDEAAAIEQQGLQPKLLTGRESNIKITRQQDLALAAFYLQQAEN